MKKTLFLSLAALFAGVAHAALTLPSANALINGNEQITSSNGTITWDTTAVDGTLTNFALTFSLDTNSDNSEHTFIAMGGGSGASGLSVSVDVNAGQPTVLILTTNNMGWITTTPVPTVEWTAGQVYTLAVLDNKAYLWQGEEIPTDLPTTYLDLSLSNFDGLTTTLTSGTSKCWTNGGKNQVTIGTVTDISALSVPEPAMASLSLLGLAALMMRRRRA